MKTKTKETELYMLVWYTKSGMQKDEKRYSPKEILQYAKSKSAEVKAPVEIWKSVGMVNF